MRGISETANGATRLQRSLRWTVFLAAAGLVVGLCVAILRPFANVIAWSAVLVIVAYPLHEGLVRRTGRVALSALTTSVLTVLACVVPLLVLGAIAVNECMALAHSLPSALHVQSEPMARAAAALQSMTRRAGLGDTTVPGWLQGLMADLLRNAGPFSISVAAGLFETVMSSLLAAFAMFLLLRDGDALVGAIPDLLPFDRHRSEALLHRVKDVVQASVYGVVVIAIVQGALCGAMFWTLGIPSGALWGAVTMFASALPVVGAFAVWGPGTLYLALTGAWSHAIVLALWGTFVVSGIDNVLRPRLVAGRVGLSELSMFFALLGGLSVFGALGIVLGPVAFATAAAMIETVRDSDPREADRKPARVLKRYVE